MLCLHLVVQFSTASCCYRDSRSYIRYPYTGCMEHSGSLPDTCVRHCPYRCHTLCTDGMRNRQIRTSL